MRSGAKKSVALVAAAVAALAVLGVGTAQADDGAGGTVVGSGATLAFSFEIDVTQRSADTRDAEGTFSAVGTPPSDLLIAPRGPATCVDIRGNTAGFLYPLAEGSRPAPAQGQNVLITVVDGGEGGQDSIGVLPTGVDIGCAPNVAPIPVTSGDIVITGG